MLHKVQTLFLKVVQVGKRLHCGLLNTSRQAGPAEFNKATKQKNPQALQRKPLWLF